MVNKLFTGRMTSRKRFAGKLDFSAKQVSTTLLLLLFGLLMPQKGWADIVTTTYDFTTKDWDKTVTYSTNVESNCTYFTKIGTVNDPERFAGQNPETWVFQRANSQGVVSNTVGFCNNNGKGRLFLVSKLYAGDVVTFDVVTLGNVSNTPTLSSSNAEQNGSTFTMKTKGSLVVSIANLNSIKTITIQHDDAGYYAYDPAIEVYDLSGINTGSASLADGTTGYQLNGSDAHYLANPSGYSLNNRLAVSQTDFTWANGLKTTKSSNQWRPLAINGLIAGDRVVITYTGTAMQFGSNSNDTNFAAAGIVFKDENNDGELNDEEVYIQGGDQVESEMVYTMEQDGHLDIRVPGNATITKIVIYGDHQATMEDRYNGSAATGYTAYFSQTGQLLAKEHIVPGGLEVHIGNEDNNQHAIVVSSDQGPVSFVYDQGHYKMARQSDNGSNITAKAPATGTFYKFMPEVDGYLTVNFKAYNIKYNDYWNGNGLSQGNEVVATSGTCPYYIMVKDVNNNFGRYVHPNGTTQYAHDLSTGDNDKFENIRVTAGNTYYVYGWWSKDPQGREPGTEGWNLGQSNCGVAQLIDVTFIPDNMVTPLAKWVASGTTADDNLADVTGFSTNDVRIKMKSANITGCTAYIENNKLKITGVTFAEGTNPGGTILIKLGDPSIDSNPVFAYTIAYDASFNMPEGAVRSEGHTWDFSTNSLKGLKWNRTSNEFEVKDFKTADDTSGLLYDEMHETNPDGSAHSDWTKTWRVINSAGEGTHDLMFLNKYDMEGDNADMMWDTEGLIFNTSSNQSCINNEFGGVVDHSKEGTRNDPDRYVGILPGGSFTIPALKAGDRVEIFMGSGDGSGDNACKFNITGALDAIGNAIDPADIYNGGGSPWVYNGGNESRYRGAYQFISTGGDMTFTMNGGSMTKLYSIKIYHGAKTATNDATKHNKDLSYNGDEYLVANNAWWLYNDYRTETPARSAYALHYRGKGERLKKPTVLYTSGNINTNNEHLMLTDDGLNFLFKSEKEQYGMFRMRIEDYELNNKFVADYAMQNVAVGYLQNKTYPYTWDFTDLKDYVDTNTRIQKERTNVANYNPRTIDEDEAYDIEFMNNSVGENVKAVEQWKSYAKSGDIPAGYGLHVRNEPYNGGVMWESGQLYAGDEIFAETFGLSISAPGVHETYNGGLRISDVEGKEGLCLTGGNWKITIPEVGTTNAVYVRATPIGDVTAGVGDAETAFTYVGTATDGTGDKIFAVKGAGADMALFFNNLIIKKIAVSNDSKTVNHLGYATESRNQEIDPELTGYMTGTGLKSYTVTKVEYGEKAGSIPSITLTEIPSENVMGPAGSASAKDHRGYIIYNTDDAVTAPEGTAADAMDANGKTKAVNILGGGFHLFYPDMHDRSTEPGAKKSILDCENDNNLLRSHINSGSIPQSDGDYTNYLMNYKYTGPDGKQHKGPEAFYRASSTATLGNNKAYLQLLTEKVKPSESNGNNGAKFAIIFVNEEQGTETTSLDGVKSTETLSGDNAIYTLSGVKVSKPEKGGIYVKNGKKFIVK